MRIARENTRNTMENEISSGLGIVMSGLGAESRSTSIFMEVKGKKQGDIKGGSTHKGQTGKIVLSGWEYQVQSPRDVTTGLATGKRLHHPVEVAGKVDKSTPLLFTALVTNEAVDVKIHVWSALAKGIGKGMGDAETYTVELTDGQIASFRHFTHVDGSLYFVAAFTFDKIMVTWVDGGITGQDDWLTSF